MKHRHDVLAIDALVVEQPCPELLHNNRIGIPIKFGNKPFGAIGMGLGLRHTRSEAGLLGHELIGRVGVEVWNDTGFLRLFGNG